MPASFGCPHCGLQTLVDDMYAGQTGPCASCGKPITVPYESSGGSSTAVQVYTRRSKTPIGMVLMLTVGGIAAAAMVVAIAIAVLFPAYTAATSIVHQRTCESNLEKIGIALRAYEADHGTLPPAFIPDATGRPMHSWRVLLLPYLDGERGLYERYDFNEPWDGPNNARLTMLMPDVYGCPADSDAHAMGETSYMVLIGAETFFPDSDPTSINQVADDPATTILVVETPVTGVGWLEPRDLKADRMQFVVNGGFDQEMGSLHTRGAHVLTADGMVHFLDDNTPTDYLKGMTTLDGGEPIPSEILD